jgi:phospholipid/cholesterol/gamma-HCH transport system substrate-binding protein
VITQASKFRVGLFVIAGTGLLIAVLIYLAFDAYFKPYRTFVTYFSENVQGLDKDSAIRYLGVKVGRVHTIQVAPDGKLVEVILHLSPGGRIEPDMRCQLEMAGITGAKYINLIRLKAGEEDKAPTLDFTPRYPYIPSKPSTVETLVTAVTKITRNIANLQLNAIGRLIRENLIAFKTILENPAWKKIVPDVAQTVASLKRSAHRLETLVGRDDHPNDLATIRRNIVAITATTRSITSTLDRQLQQIQLAKTVKRLDQVVRLQAKSLGQLVGSAKKLVDDLRAELAAIRYAIRRSSGNLSQATAELKQLIFKLKTQPSQLLFGQPVPDRFPRGSRR